MQKPDAASSGSTTAKKRSYDSVNESDEDMKDCESVEGDESVEGRLGQAPFQDG
jgi:hypothetical protein